ncbi:MAG: FtsX-like permease family protein [Acidimicrobiia bacterium]|nr:FtsX-like permease family protein [Acidimicrobiia bacterium]
MWKITLKNLAANKARLSLTGLAIVLGVGFVVASFITSDGLRDAFGTLSKDIASGPELIVREGDEFGVNPVIDESTLAAITSVDGVASAEGTISGRVQPVRADGTAVETAGPPLIGFSWPEVIDDGRSTIVEGTAPGPGEFVMDLDSAAANGFDVGQTYTVTTTEGRFDGFTLSGLFRFGDNNDTLGAVLTGYHLDDTRTILGVADGVFDGIEIMTGDGWNASEVEAAVAAKLSASEVGDGIEVVNQKTVEEETAADFNEAVGIIENVFLGFAGVSLFVSIFIIYNTFGVVLAQRVREIGMLRAVGAEAKQIRRGVVGEALAIGLIASAVGVAAGIGLHIGLLAMFDAIGVGLPDTALIIAPRTIIAGMTVGVLATVVSAVAPAVRASRVTPIAALSGDIGADHRTGGRRIIVGVVMLAIGLTAGVLGFQGLGSTALTVAALAGGAVLVFLAVTLLSPLAARPVIGTLAVPMGVAGTQGSLAGKNAVRNPRRTATTAGALMIGLSLITAALVVGDSLKTQVGQTLEQSISADYLISDPSFYEVPVEVADQVAAMPEIGNLMTVDETFVRITTSGTGGSDGITEEVWYNVSDLESVAALMDLGIDRGSLGNVDAANAMVLPTDEADEYGMEIGDTMLVEFAEGGSAEFELVATSTDESIVSGGWLNLAGVDEHVERTGVVWIAAQVADDFTAAEAEAAMAAVTVDYPQVEVQSSAQYQESIEAEVDMLMNTISAMLALAIVIALLGIGLTLALSIVERTREIGLLRAVGMTRGQTRGMIRWEAAAIALFGAVLGVATGLLFGWGAVQALPDTFISVVSVPVGRLAIMVAAAGLAGLVAALLPARRAGRLDVLDAIAVGG